MKPLPVSTPLCFDCKHFGGTATPGTLAVYQCAAFPNGIPSAILVLEHDHRRPYPGDNDIQFEPRPKFTPIAF